MNNEAQDVRKAIDLFLNGIGLRSGPYEPEPLVTYFEPNESAQGWESGYLTKFSWNSLDNTIQFSVRIFDSFLVLPVDLESVQAKLPENWRLYFDSGKGKMEVWLKFIFSPDEKSRSFALAIPGYLENVLAIPAKIIGEVEGGCRDLVNTLCAEGISDLHDVFTPKFEGRNWFKGFESRIAALHREAAKIQSITTDNHFTPPLRIPDGVLAQAYMQILDVDPMGRTKLFRLKAGYSS